MVEVVKGGEGERCLSVRFTLFTAKGSVCSSAMIACTSFSVSGSYFFPFLP